VEVVFSDRPGTPRELGLARDLAASIDAEAAVIKARQILALRAVNAPAGYFESCPPGVVLAFLKDALRAFRLGLPA
jgi:hypothetical protein